MTSKTVPLYAVKAGDIVRVDYGNSSGSKSIGPATVGGSESEGVFLILDNICQRDGYHNYNYLTKSICLFSKNGDEKIGSIDFRAFSYKCEVLDIDKQELDLMNLA